MVGGSYRTKNIKEEKNHLEITKLFILHILYYIYYIYIIFIRGESLSLVHPCLFVSQLVSQLVSPT